MITYRDMTFCVNEKCTKKCFKYLTCKIQKAAEAYGLPLAVASFVCLEQDDDGVYRLQEDKEEC